MTFRSILSLVLVLTLGGACKGDDKGATPVEGGSSGTTARAEAGGGDLASKLLTVAEMPTGYSLSTDDDDDDDDESDPSGCPALDAYEKKYGDPAEEVSIDFQKGEASIAGGQFLGESIERHESEDAANDAFDAAVDAFQSCKEFESTDRDGSKFTGTMSPLSFPKLRDDTFAVHMKVKVASDGFEIEMGGDIVAFRSDRLVATVISFGFGGGSVPISEVETIVRRAAGKL